MKHRQECLQNREMFLNHKLGNNNQDMKDETRHDSKNAENHTEGCCTIKVIKGH